MYNSHFARLDSVELLSLRDITVESDSSVGYYGSVAIGSDNNPVISHYDATNLAVRVYVCANTLCSSGTERTVDSTGGRTSIAIGNDSNPVIAYALGVFICADTICSIGAAQGVAMSDYKSTAIGANGAPVVAYNDNLDLKVFTCGNSGC